MAGPTVDSANFDPLANVPPESGPGSKTPPDPLYGVQTPIGGSKTLPQGEKGAPPKPPAGGLPPLGGPPLGGPSLGGPPPMSADIADMQLLTRGSESLVEDIDTLISKDSKYSHSVEALINGLLDMGWDIDQLKKYIRKSKKPAKEFFSVIVKSLKSNGLLDTANKLEQMISTSSTNLVGQPDTTGIKPPLKQSERGISMGKRFIVRNGSVEEAQSSASVILENLFKAMRKAASAIREYETANLMLVGKIALEKDAVGDLAKGDLAAGDMLGEGFEEDGLGEGVSDLKSEVKEKLNEIESAISGLKKIISEGESELLDVESPLNAEESLSLEDGLKKAKEVLSKARSVYACAIEDKKKKEKSNDAMSMALGKKSAAEGEKDKKDDKKDEKKDDKKKKEDDDEDDDSEVKKDKGTKKEKDAAELGEDASTLEGLIKRVRAKLLNEVEKKEAQLYPFKDISGNASKVDNINETSAQQAKSTSDKFMKGEMKKMKDSPTVNAAPYSYDSIPVSSDGKNAAPKKVSSLEESSLINKAKLAVELASQQQLKGLIENPLKTSIVRGLAEAGIDPALAETVVHNAFIDAYEDSQKIIIKEAFDNFVHKDINEFIKIAKFVRKYSGEGVVDAAISSEQEQANNDVVKTASVALKPSKVSNVKDDEIKKYWNTVKYNRRGF